MWRNALVVRNNEKLANALKDIAALRFRMPEVKINGIKELRSFLELENLFDAGESIIRAAQHRAESRGSHFREDYPDQDPQWDKRILIGYRNGEITKREELI